MKKNRYSEEQIIAVLKEHQAGIPVAELCRKHCISDATFYNQQGVEEGMRSAARSCIPEAFVVMEGGW